MKLWRNLFFQILRNHVMVRVGGGWDTLQHYLDKHDPCRCRAGEFIHIDSYSREYSKHMWEMSEISFGLSEKTRSTMLGLMGRRDREWARIFSTGRREDSLSVCSKERVVMVKGGKKERKKEKPPTERIWARCHSQSQDGKHNAKWRERRSFRGKQNPIKVPMVKRQVIKSKGNKDLFSVLRYVF